MDNLYIPKKIKVGFQNRTGTYTGKLAYVSYIDSKGVFRKEKSWQQWRDKNIKPIELDNSPQEGFCLNKEIERYNWSHFSSNRSYIRMYDPRGIEFEVSPENLIGILTESNCLREVLKVNLYMLGMAQNWFFYPVFQKNIQMLRNIPKDNHKMCLLKI